MSKSLGNVLLLSDLFEQFPDPRPTGCSVLELTTGPRSR